MSSLSPTPLTPRPGATETFQSGIGLNLKAVLAESEQTVELEVSYTPDRDVVQPEALQTWLTEMAQKKWATAEEFVQTVTENFYNKLLPRTVTTTLRHTQETAHGALHQRVNHTCSQPKK